MTSTTNQETHRKIQIFINDHHYMAPNPVMTGRVLLGLDGVPEENQLFLEVPGPGDDEPIGLDDPVELRSGMRFYDVPPGNFG
jgi:hypothetical protein